MGEIVHALLFDTRSIQRYIYAGNRLKTNIGASYLVDTVFTQELFPVVAEALPDGGIDTDSWQEKLPVEKLQQPQQCVVASNGGGNALLLFSKDVTEETLLQIVRTFTENLLVTRPGLHVGAARGEMNLDPAVFQQDLGKLFQKLKANQNVVFPQVNVPYTGLTLSCEVNGEAANYFDAHQQVRPDGGEVRFYSQEVAVKAKAAVKATENLQKKYPDIAASYTFPLEIDRLGQKESENYYSIVHIDGNNMGEKFRGCHTQEERSHLSENVRRKTEGCFGRLLESIDAEYASYRDFLDLVPDAHEEKRRMPIRPIILGGDDVTFVCPAKVAIRYTKRFMEAMMDPDAVPGIDAEAAKRIDCCAGIAIVKEQIREQEYNSVRGNMHFGPYQVCHTEGTAPKEHRYDIEHLIEAVHQLQDGCMAHGKAKELRDVLQHGKHDAQRFLLQLDHMNQELPDIREWDVYAEPENALWSGGRTPYVDAIELMDFIPQGGEGK